MAKYDIKRKDLKDKLDLLEKYAPEEIDDINLLKSTIENLKNNFKNFEKERELSIIDGLKEDLEDFDYFTPYYQQVRKFYKKSSFEVFGKPSIKFQKLNISDDEAVSLAHDFFKEQGNFFYNPFVSYTLNMEDHLKFIAPSKYSDGMMVYVKSLDESFVFVPGYRNLTKFTILVHEIEHALDTMNNQDFIYNFFVREVSAIFMELISCDWFCKNKVTSKDNFKRRFQLHVNVKEACDTIYLKNRVLALIKKYPHSTDEDLIKILKEKYKYEEETLEYLAIYSLSSDYIYQIPYLIAIELYSIYQTDKEKALYILENIILYGNNNNIFSILENFKINLTTTLYDYEENLYDSLTKKFVK